MPTRSRQARSLLLACLLAVAPRLFGQSPPATPQHIRDVVHRVELGSPTRILIDCDGPWQYSTDGDSWSTITIPTAFEEQGKFQLRKTFSLTAQQRKGAVWSFVALGVNYQCDILVNEQFVSHHVGGYTSCIVSIPDYTLHDGENAIRLAGSNELGARETAPASLGSFFPKNYGGMFRSAAIVGMPPITISDIETHVTLEGDHAQLAARVQLTAGHLTGIPVSDSNRHSADVPAVHFSLKAEVLDVAGAVVTTTVIPSEITDFRTRDVNLSVLIANPKLWSVSSPSLYTLRCTLIRDTAPEDVFSMTFGIRTFELAGTQFRLNGNPFELKGIVYHEDVMRMGNAVDYATLETDVQLIKTLGANAIRLEHPASPLLLWLCDEYGLLVFEQIPTIAVPPSILNGSNYVSLCKNNVQALIQRDRNHACVVAWGLGSNIDAERSGEYLEQTAAFAHTFDSRPTYCTTTLSAAPARGCDLYFLELFNLEQSEFTARIASWKARYPRTPLIAAAYGKTFRATNHNGYSDPLSVESQAKYVLTAFNILRQDSAAGSFLCAFSDWGSDRPSILSVESNAYVNYAGLLSYGRDERRLSFDVAKALFTNDKIPTIIVGEDLANAPVIYIVLGLVFLLLLVYLANNSRRFRENFSRAIFRPFNFFADIRDQRILSTIQTTMLGVITAGTFAIFVSSIAYYLRNSMGFDMLLNAVVASNVLKYRFAQLVWNPVECVIVLTLLFFTMLIVVTATIRFCAIFVRPRIFFGDAYTIVLWAGLPTIIMIPISMILYRVMMFGPYVVTSVLLGIVVLVWIAFRMLRGTAVVFDVPFRRVYSVALGLAVASAAAIIYIYDSKTALLAQLEMLYHQFMS